MNHVGVLAWLFVSRWVLVFLGLETESWIFSNWFYLAFFFGTVVPGGPASPAKPFKTRADGRRLALGVDGRQAL